MTLRGAKPSASGEVTVASPPGGAPRLDFSRFSAFGFQDDASKSALPRSKSSSYIHHPSRRHISVDDDSDDSYPLDTREFRARSECDREGLGHLIDFLRSTSPPPQNYLPSAFDDDGEPTEERGRWRQLKRKLRLPRIKPGLNSGDAPIKYKVYEPAVASRTSEGYPHMAISIPMEHCHVGPDSDWAVPAFNATKPLPPSPPPEDREMTLDTRARSVSCQRRKASLPEAGSGDDDFITMKPVRSMPRMHNKDLHPAIHLWQRNLPLSPPQSPPPRTAPGDVQRPFAGSPMQLPRAHLPMDVDSYTELPGSPPSSSSPKRVKTPKTPESVEDRMRNVHVSWLKTTQLLQSAPGPPPRSAPHPAPYSSFHPARPDTSPTKPLPKRPDNLRLPVRKSSLKNPGLAKIRAQSRPSLDSVLASQKGQDRLSAALVEKPEPSPTAQSEHSVASSIVTQDSEPVVANARAVRGYSNASIVLQSTPGTTPRASFIMLTPDKNLSMMSTGEDTTPTARTQRKASTRTNASRKSRAERVKSLKQRDMEAARAKLQCLHQQEQTGDVDMEARPHTADTVISALRLPSREGGPDTPSVSSFAEFFPRPPTAEDNRASYRRDSGLVSQSRSRNYCSEPAFGQEADRLAPGAVISARDSFCSSQGARRHNSYQRTSWASSIPLLDRISSYAPSEASFMEILDSAAPTTNPHRRSDSATLPHVEQERLAPSRLSLVPSVNMEGLESGCPSQRQSTLSFAGGLGLGLCDSSDIRLPATAFRPCTPPEERWSATTARFTETPATASSPQTSTTASLGPDRTSADLTPPASRRGSPKESTLPDCGNEGVVSTQYAPQDEWIFDDVQEVPLHMDSRDSVPALTTHFNGSVHQRGSNQLLRVPSADLRAHYTNLRRLEVGPDLAHQMLLNQERIELDMRRNEQNQMRIDQDMRRSEQNQMVFVNRVEQVLEKLGHGRPLSGTPRASLGWKDDDETDTRRHACQPTTAHMHIVEDLEPDADDAPGRHRPREARGPRTRTRLARYEGQRHEQHMQSPAGADGSLEAMGPLMQELHTASRVSLESARDQQHRDAPAIGGRELDAYFNMI